MDKQEYIQHIGNYYVVFPTRAMIERFEYPTDIIEERQTPETVMITASSEEVDCFLINKYGPDGEPVCFFGWEYSPRNSVRVFMFPCKNFKKMFSKTVYKIIQGYLKKLCDYYPRVEAECVTGNATLERFLEHLGFKLEAVERKASIVFTDMNLYSIINEKAIEQWRAKL